jgi:hypothetical protein
MVGDFSGQGLVGSNYATARAGQTYLAGLARQFIMSTEGNIKAGHGNLASGLMRSSFSQVVGAVNKEVGLSIQQFSKTLAASTTRNRDGRVTRIHKIAGQEAINATVSAYSNRRKAAGIASVRSDRYSGGKLQRALGSPEMMLATWEGVSFINQAHLDRTAKQWYRLNFGAGEKGRNESLPHKRWNIKFYGEAISAISLKEFGPSADFEIPDGFSIGSGISREFVPQSLGSVIPEGVNRTRVKKQVTAGIQGQAFLDAGVRTLAKNLGTGWSILWREWLEEAGQHETGPVALAGIPKAQIAESLKVTAKTRSFTQKDLQKYKSALARFSV